MRRAARRLRATLRRQLAAVVATTAGLMALQVALLVADRRRSPTFDLAAGVVPFASGPGVAATAIHGAATYWVLPVLALGAGAVAELHDTGLIETLQRRGASPRSLVVVGFVVSMLTALTATLASAAVIAVGAALIDSGSGPAGWEALPPPANVVGQVLLIWTVWWSLALAIAAFVRTRALTVLFFGALAFLLVVADTVPSSRAWNPASWARSVIGDTSTLRPLPVAVWSDGDAVAGWWPRSVLLIAVSLVVAVLRLRTERFGDAGT